LPSRERNIGMVFQDYGLYPHMNTYQNIAYGLEARGMPHHEVDRRVNWAAEKLGITPFLKRIIVDMSGGEQQRVALARALAKDADLYLFDEPLSNLDPKLRAQARRDILMVHREKHKPTLYVTHDQTEAMAIGDRIGVIARGRLEQVGTVEELVHNPANTFVAQFIGTPPMNLVTATLIREGMDLHLHGDGLALTLPRTTASQLSGYTKDQVILGIRAQAVGHESLPNEFEIRPENTITGRIEDIEPLVGETVITLKVGVDTILSLVFQEIFEGWVPGLSINIGVDMSQVRLFDPETENALLAFEQSG